MWGELSWGEFYVGRVVLGRVVFGASCPDSVPIETAFTLKILNINAFQIASMFSGKPIIVLSKLFCLLNGV